MEEERKRAFFWGFTCSFIYLACFFLSFYLFVFAPQLLGNPDMTTGIGLSLIFLSLLTPLSIVVSIFLIWNRYLNQKYRGMYLSCLLPPAVVLIVIILLNTINLFLL